MILLKNLKKNYGKNNFKAVDIKSLYIKKAQIVSLIGPSGCGKTTTLKIINNLIQADEGFVEINGEKNTESDPVLWRRKIGYVIQKIGLFPHLTILQNISILSYVLKRNKKFIQERSYELMELVGLNPKDYKNRYPLELSGGQQQKIGLARALMENPPLLLMDEAFRSLDPLTSRSMRKEFLKLNQKLKKTIVLVTHDIQEAFEMGDLVVLMQKGRIVQKGTREDFKKNPKNLFVENFLNKKN
ncbi:MAG: ATP-binding cassette domain-containing protein [Bdellovibrionales bacterium]|nr:ATP-binding cassette domain-containing protein [Bdellovibrionales bacterium]